MKTIAATLISLFLGVLLIYEFSCDKGKYVINTSNSLLDAPLHADTVYEDTIQHKIRFTDLFFKDEFIIQGNYIIKTNKTK